jgi:ABC-type multidrug transport system fused ATPase/permease subunit
MLRLLKYLKPYLLLILLTIVLLFVQANADLALPDYLSKIVNNGIQQGGVEDAVPVAIRQSEMDKLVLFMSAEDKALVLANYLLVEPTSPAAAQYIKDYPALANVPVYVLQNVDRAKMDQLNPIMGKAWLVVSSIEQIMADPAKAAARVLVLTFPRSLPARIFLPCWPSCPRRSSRKSVARSMRNSPPWGLVWSPKWRSLRSKPNTRPSVWTPPASRESTFCASAASCC